MQHPLHEHRIEQDAAEQASRAPDSCAAVIEHIAEEIDARSLNLSYPRYFPRLIQFAIWHFCAENGLAICNGRNIDDRRRCEQRFCPPFDHCERKALYFPLPP